MRATSDISLEKVWITQFAAWHWHWNFQPSPSTRSFRRCGSLIDKAAKTREMRNRIKNACVAIKKRDFVRSNRRRIQLDAGCDGREETAKKSWNSNQHSKTIWVISSTWAYRAAQWVWIFNFRKWRAISSDKTQKKRWVEMMIMRQRWLKDFHLVIGIFAIRIASSTRGFVDSRRIRQSVGKVLRACEFFNFIFVNSHDTFHFFFNFFFHISHSDFV